MSKKKTATVVPVRRRTGNIRWDKLDNTALLFPSIVGEDMTNVYRISAILKEPIQQELLQKALDLVLPQFDTFNVRLRTGVFWYYFEENGKPAPRVTEENTFPCRRIQQNKNHSYLFRVTYYGCRINLEVFHVLTDGMGGISFLRELVYQYLRLAHPALREIHDDVLSPGTSLSREDSFVQNYKKSMPSGFQKTRAYTLKLDALPAGEFGVMHGTMPIKDLKAVCRDRGVSINDYLVACFVWSVYTGCLKGMPSDKPIRVAVPINLRPYFDSITAKNFFVMISAEFLPEKDRYSFEEVLALVQKSIHSQIERDHLEELFSYSVSNQKKLILRPTPLFLKSWLMRAVYRRSAYANTTTITNIGSIAVHEEYSPYIESFHAFLAMSKGQPLKGTICSYGDQLTFSFSTTLADPLVERGFFRRLVADGIPVSITTNQVFC